LLQAFHVVGCADPTGLALPSAPKHRNPDFPQRGDATMTERRPIFSTTGDQIGYTEGNAAFDLFDRRRCSYDSATGNLSDFTTGKLVGYVSFARNFVVPSRIAAELFGQPREADADPSNMVELPSPSSSTDWQSAAADGSGAPAGLAAPARSEVFDGNPPETGFDTSSDLHAPDPTESSVSEDDIELLERAIRMIRSGLDKRPL
jgi:hypothetical protein